MICRADFQLSLCHVGFNKSCKILGFKDATQAYQASTASLSVFFRLHNVRIFAMQFLMSLCISLLVPLSVHAQDNQMDSTKERERLQTLIQQQWDEYNKRPRKLFLARKNNLPILETYAAECFRKIQTIGNFYYPRKAMGKIYGSVILSFEVIPEGVIRNVSIVHSSGHDVLDNHAKQTVEVAYACQPYPAELKERADIIMLTREFS